MAYIKKTEKRMVEKEVTISETYACDICGAATEAVYGGDPDWATSDSEEPIVVTTVCMKTGRASCEEARFEEREYHICEKCFQEKVVPLFGTAKPTVTEYDF